MLLVQVLLFAPNTHRSGQKRLNQPQTIAVNDESMLIALIRPIYIISWGINYENLCSRVENFTFLFLFEPEIIFFSSDYQIVIHSSWRCSRANGRLTFHFIYFNISTTRRWWIAQTKNNRPIHHIRIFANGWHVTCLNYEVMSR